MVFEPISGTVDEFISYALMVVGIMIIYYVVKFFLVAPPTEEEKKRKEKEREERGEKTREFLKKKIKESKEKEKAEKKKKKRTEEGRDKRREKQKAVKRIEEKVGAYLMSVISNIDEAIKKMKEGEMEEAKKLLAKAKRRMTQARNSEVLEDLAKGTPYLDRAKWLRAEIVRARIAMDHLTLVENDLKTFNAGVGAIMHYIGELVKNIYG